MKPLLIALFTVLTLSACSSDDNNTPVDYSEQNDADIQAYITENNLNATKTASGLYYVVDQQGTGEKPNSNSDVTVSYKGYFLNGTVFDQSDADGISFNLQQVIAGWTEGITYYNEGGSGTLLVPAHLGYGSYGYGSIPGGSVLIFDIELIAVN